MKKQLKKGAVPNLFAWTPEPKPASVQRASHARKRIKRFEEPHVPEIPVPDVGREETVDNEERHIEQARPFQEEATVKRTASRVTQTPLDIPMSVERFMNKDKAIHHFTGLESYAKFLFVLSTLGPAAHDLNYRWRQCHFLSVADKFFLTLMKLRQHRSNYDISWMFNISEFSVANIFVTWVNFMYNQWKELDIWPTRDLVSYYMPQGFSKNFPTTRVILDGMDCPIQKPKCPLSQQVTFSTYKNKNTAKVVVGASPGGLVSHIPDAYGGSTSDRQLVERSDLTKKCDSGDSLMADKGINVQDLFASNNITINIPTFLRKGNQFTAKTLA